MPINPTTLKALIDTQITNETVDFAITPNEVGSRMKDTIDYTTEQKALSEVLTNKSTNTGLGGNTPSDILYPSQKATKIYVDGINSNLENTIFDLNQDVAQKENVANKSTNVNLGTSNTLYPTQNAVKTYVDANAGGGSQVVKSVKVTLTPLQVQSLFTTPIKVIDCAVGKVVLPIQMLNVSDNPTAGYFPSGGNIALRYENLGTNILTGPTTLGNFGIGEAYAISVTSTSSGGFSRNGEDVYVRLLTADPVGGDGGMVVYITYSEITL